MAQKKNSAHSQVRDTTGVDISYGSVFHSMKTPLSIMYMNLQIATMQAADNPILLKTIGYIKSNWFQVLKIVQDTCDSQKMMAGGEMPMYANCDMVLLMKRLAESGMSLGKRKNIDVRFSCDFDQKIWATDKNMVERIVLNFIAFAIRQGHEGGYVTLGLLMEKNKLVVTMAYEGAKPDFTQLRTVLGLGNKNMSMEKPDASVLWMLVVAQLLDLLQANVVLRVMEAYTHINIIIPQQNPIQRRAKRIVQDDFYNEHIVQIELS